jgi:pilus assembly protein FimV
VPPLEVIAAIPKQEAIDEVQQQTYAWRMDVQAPGTLASAPVATGQPKAVPQGEQPTADMRLKVVSPMVSSTTDAASATTGSTTEPQATVLREELALANEELGTQRQENEQLRARIVELEGMVSSMERLITLKTEELTQLQARMNVLEQAVEAKGTADSALATEPDTHSEGTATGSKSASTSQRAQVLPKATASTENTSLDQGMLGNSFVLGALSVGVLPLLIALWWVTKRRRARGTVVDSSEALLTLSPSASQDTAAVTTAASVTTGATHPRVERPTLAETRLDQDLKQAFRTTPATSVVADAAIADRAVPPIDVPLFDFGTDETPEIAFSTVVDPVETVELRPMVDDRADDLERFAIDVELKFGGAGQTGRAGLSELHQGVHVPEVGTGDEDLNETLRIERQAEADDHTIEFVLPPQDRDETAGLERQKQPSIVDSTLEFELSPKDIDLDQETSLDTAGRSLEAEIGNDPDKTSRLAPEMHESNIESLWASSRAEADGEDSETACEKDGSKTLAVEVDDLPKFGINSAEVALEEGWQTLASMGTGNDFAGDDFVLDPEVPSGLAAVQTKLDLAKVYIELGVFEDAGSLLQEVKEQGDDTQRQEAQELLRKIA